MALSVPTLVATYDARWAIEIAIRDGHAYDGVAQAQGRKVEAHCGRQYLAVAPGGRPDLVVHRYQRAAGRRGAAAVAAVVPSQGGPKPV